MFIVCECGPTTICSVEMKSTADVEVVMMAALVVSRGSRTAGDKVVGVGVTAGTIKAFVVLRAMAKVIKGSINMIGLVVRPWTRPLQWEKDIGKLLETEMVDCSEDIYDEQQKYI